MGSDSPITIDIVVNNYNYEAYVRQAVDSACAQEYPSVNVIVVDDGSTDGSRELLAGYGDEIDLVLKENGGQASALNAGFARCRGQAVIFLDADDVLAPDAASMVADAFASGRQAARLHFRLGVIDADGRSLGSTKPSRDEQMLSGDLHEAELAFPFDLQWVATSGNAYRTDVLRRIMPVPENTYELCADYYLVHLTALLGPILARDDIGAYYRLHGGNGFEPAAPVLSLERIRREIIYQQATSAALTELADELELDRPEIILSISNLALRIISHKLDPAQHPITGDRSVRLLLQGLRAAQRRHNLPIPSRVMLLGALSAIAVLPRPLARRMAELLVFPQRRPRMTRLIRKSEDGNA